MRNKLTTTLQAPLSILNSLECIAGAVAARYMFVPSPMCLPAPCDFGSCIWLKCIQQEFCELLPLAGRELAGLLE